MVSCRFPLNQSNDLPKFKSNLGPDDPPARRTPRPPEDLRPDFGSGLVRTSGIFPQSLSLSLYQSPGLLLTGPLLKVAILSKNKQFQKKISKIQKQTFQTVNPTIQQETRNQKKTQITPNLA